MLARRIVAVLILFGPPTAAAATDDELFDVRGAAVRPGFAFRMTAKQTGKPYRITLSSEGVTVQETTYDMVRVHEGEYVVEAADHRQLTKVRGRIINDETTLTRFDGEQEIIRHQVSPLVGREVVAEAKEGFAKSRLVAGEPTEEETKALANLPQFGDERWFPKDKVPVGAEWKMDSRLYALPLAMGGDVKVTGDVKSKFEAVQAFEGRRCAVIRTTGSLRGSFSAEGRTTDYEVEIDTTQYRSLDTHVPLQVEVRVAAKTWGPVKFGADEYQRTIEAKYKTTYRRKVLKEWTVPTKG